MIQNALFPATHFRVERDLAYGPEARHGIDFYWPRWQAPKALVIFFYGGSWTRGSRGLYRFLGSALTGRGYAAAVADYRLYPETSYPGFLHDCALATGFATRHAGAEADLPVVLMGHSAGGYNAAMLALDPQYLTQAQISPSAIAGVICLAAPLTFDPLKTDSTRAVFLPSEAAPDEARPVKMVRAGAPPFLLLHGEDDRTVGAHNSRNFAKAYGEAGGSAQLRPYPKVNHLNIITSFAWPLRWQSPALHDVSQFIDAHATQRAAPVDRTSEAVLG